MSAPKHGVMVQVVERPTAPRSHKTAPQLIGLAAFLAATFLVSWLGAVATSSSVGTWYMEIQKPAFTPPGAVIGAVWSVLFALIAVAAWLVWRERGLFGARTALTLYAVQLGLNLLWSVVFFGLRAPGAALVEIGALWVAIVATMVAFWRILPSAGALLIPYLAWVTFAAFLNATIWRLNAGF